MSNYSPIYRHWNTVPPRGKELDANNDNLADYINARNNATASWDKMSVTLSVYANNAAAVTGGLAVGTFYRTGGDPDLVCVVH
jgi:hypothetical protein